VGKMQSPSVLKWLVTDMLKSVKFFWISIFVQREENFQLTPAPSSNSIEQNPSGETEKRLFSKEMLCSLWNLKGQY
jgi:hypothetical protein